MQLVYDWLIPTMWLAFLAYWWALAARVKSTEREESLPSRAIRALALLGAVALLWPKRFPVLGLDGRFLPAATWCFWLGAGVTAAGLLFSVWARRHLGSNWSQAVTLKADHELITTGPYAMVRHPIYTGLLTGFLGCALARGEWRGLVAMALVGAVLWWKVRLEESWLQVQFGDAWLGYSRRVGALLPGRRGR